MIKDRIFLYSPSASEPLGHPMYVQQLVKYISREYDVVLFTLKHYELNEALQQLGAKLIISEKYEPGIMDKNRFVSFGFMSKMIYGFRRIKYSFTLLRDFYSQQNESCIFHLLEFEYISCFYYFLFNKIKLKNTILGFHAADFSWIKGRSLQINLYKFLIRFLLSFSIKDALAITVMGETLKEKFIQDLRLNRIRDKIFFTGYGCDVTFNDVDKIQARESIGIQLEPGHLLGLFFGIIREDKGIFELLECLRNIDQKVYLLIAGPTWNITEIEIIKKIKSLGIKDRVILRVGYIEEQHIKLYFSASDFVFLTHKKSFYSFSGPLSLSVEHRRPVISTDVGELGYFVKKFRLGITYEADNWKDLIAKSNHFISSNIPINKREFGFDEALSFNSWEVVASRITDIYRKCSNKEGDTVYYAS